MNSNLSLLQSIFWTVSRTIRHPELSLVSKPQRGTYSLRFAANPTREAHKSFPRTQKLCLRSCAFELFVRTQFKCLPSHPLPVQRSPVLRPSSRVAFCGRCRNNTSESSIFTIARNARFIRSQSIKLGRFMDLTATSCRPPARLWWSRSPNRLVNTACQ